MATYYVDFKNGNDSTGNGTNTQPWKTPAKAVTVVATGDTVKFRGNKTDSTTFYTAAWDATVANTTWENDTGHTPTWHGGYYTNPNNFGLTGTRPGGAYSPMIKIAAHNVTLRGLRVQHVGGVGFTISETSGGVGIQGALITACESAYTYGAALVIKTGAKGILVDGPEISYCTFIGMGLGKFDPDKESGDRGEDAVQGSIQLLHCKDAHVHHNLFAYGHGEGVNVGRGSTRTILEYNTVHTMDHIHIAIVRCVECDVRYNVVYHSKHPWYLGGRSGSVDVPPGIRIGDENSAKMQEYPHSSKQRVYGNLVYGGSYPFTVQNGGNFDTQLNQAYIGFNTFIAEAAEPGISLPPSNYALLITDRTLGPDHTQSVFENNIIYAPSDVILTKIAGANGITFRNNSWYVAGQTPDQVKAKVPTVAQHVGDIYADPKITAPGTRMVDAFPNPATGATGFSFDNYRLAATSPVIGRSSDRSYINGVTPPTMPTDITGTTRSNLDADALRFWDIGALEYGGTAPTNNVTANFTASSTGGQAPLTVTFTSTSTTTGAAAISSYVMNFGDGSTDINATGNFSHTYGSPGGYTPVLTVQDAALGLSSFKTGSVITVTTAPIGTASGVDAARAVLPTSAGTYNIPVNLGGKTPALALFVVTKATAAGAAVGGAMLSYGAAATVAGQWAAALSSADGQAISDANKYQTNAACIVTLDATGVTGSAAFVSFGSNLITLNVTDAFPEGYLVDVLVFGATGTTGAAGTFSLGAIGSNTVLAPGFVPTLYLFGGASVQNDNALADTADFLFGAADATRQLGMYWRDRDALETTAGKALISGDDQQRVIVNPVATGDGGFNNYGAGQLTVARGDINRRFTYAGLGLPTGLRAAAKAFATPTSTGSQSYSLGFQPAGVMLVLTLLEATNTVVTTAASDGMAIVVADSGATYCQSIGAQSGQATSNTQSRADTSIVVTDGAGVVKLAGTLTLDSDGFDINWTTVQASARYFYAVGVEGVVTSSGPVAAFSANTTAPANGIVQFTDLSNANGAAITARLWNFGDGDTSTATNPEHTYQVNGTFTVSLTVTNANGSHTATRVNYITVGPPATQWLMGPYDPMTITNTTVNRLHGDNEADPLYGYAEHALYLDGLHIVAQPDTAATPPVGMVRLEADYANKRFKVIWPDGTTGFITPS